MKRRILVIDDDPDITKFFRIALESHGDMVDVAANGKEALSRMVESRPDIIFLDLMLPELNGFEIVEALCSTGAPRPRIFVMTAKHLTARERAYLEEHVEMIIQKGPDDLSEVLDRVMQSLDNK